MPNLVPAGIFFARQPFFKCPQDLFQTFFCTDFLIKQDWLYIIVYSNGLFFAHHHFLTKIFARLRKRLGTADFDLKELLEFRPKNWPRFINISDLKSLKKVKKCVKYHFMKKKRMKLCTFRYWYSGKYPKDNSNKLQYRNNASLFHQKICILCFLLIIINYSFSILHRLMGSQLTVNDQLLNGTKFN